MAISEDIGKPFPRLLEPREAQPRNDCRNQRVNTQHEKVRWFTPIQHISRLLNNGCERGVIEPLPEFLWQRGDGVENRGHEHQHRSEESRVGKECVITCMSRWSPEE